MSEISLNEVTIDNIGSWPSVFKVVLIAVLFSLIIGLGYLLSIQEQLEELDSLRAKEVELIQTMERKQQQAANLKLYQRQLIEMRTKLGKLLKQLPGKSEIPELLEEISQTGLTSGLKFQLFDPQPEISHDFYVEVPIKIIVDGSFHQMTKFISRVANMKRIVTMHDFKLRFPNPKKAEGKKPIRLINGKLPLFLTITAKVYRYQTFE
jgi:type IV pilus assembly protein PilO